MYKIIEIVKQIDLDVEGNTLNLEKEISVRIDCVDCVCGERLTFKVSSDSCGDIQIEVEGHSCIQDEE